MNKRPLLDARPLGAKCDECPLRGQNPVPPELRPDARLVIVGEGPGPVEDALGKPFIGQSGYRLNKALLELGTRRADVAVTNATLCYPPRQLKPKEWRTALEACRPRLEAELRPGQTLLACGAKALQTLTGKAKIMPWMGAPLTSRTGHLVIGSIHPAFALRSPAYLPVFKTFVARALDAAHGRLTWAWPEAVNEAPFEPVLARLLSQHQAGEPLAIDIESRPSNGRLRIIGVGTAHLVAAIPVELPLPQSTYDALRALFATPQTKVFQNAQFDVAELKQHGYTISGPIYDTMLVHAVLAPRLPHNLSFMAAVEFPAERWKTEHRVEGDDKSTRVTWFDKAPLDELAAYNNRDVAATARLKYVFDARLKTVHRGEELAQRLHALDVIALKMRERGVAVAQENFAHHKEALNEELWRQVIAFRKLIPEQEYVFGRNGLHRTLGKLFFERFSAPVVSRNKDTGKPSLDGEALQKYIGIYAETAPQIAAVARSIHQYRRYSKLLGSYVENLPVGEDGRAHPWWRVFGARTGRWSATDPALQTIPPPNERAGTPGMRDLFCAGPGLWLCEGDYSQLELRIVALLSGDEKLLQWFKDGEDVHARNASEIFQTKVPTDQQRKLSKRTVFGLNYGGSAETVWRSMVVDYPDLKLATIRGVVDGWFKTHPSIAQWQEDLKREAQRQGFVEEPLSGRRQYYQDGKIVPTEVLNYPIQGAAGELANRAVIALDQAVDWRTTWLLAQVHDSCIVEGPNPKTLCGIVREAMEQTVTLNGADIKFPIDLKVGQNWGYMKKEAGK